MEDLRGAAFTVDAAPPNLRPRSPEERRALELANGRDPLARRVNELARFAGVLVLLAFVLLAVLRGGWWSP